MGERVSETGIGSAQVGELKAVFLAAQHGADYVYTDSYAVFKGARVDEPLGSQRLTGK